MGEGGDELVFDLVMCIVSRFVKLECLNSQLLPRTTGPRPALQATWKGSRSVLQLHTFSSCSRYKERLELKYMRTNPKSAALNGKKWTFVRSDMDDLRSGVPVSMTEKDMVIKVHALNSYVAYIIIMSVSTQECTHCTVDGQCPLLLQCTEVASILE